MEEEKALIKEKFNIKFMKVLVGIASTIILIVLLFLFIESFIYTAYFNNPSFDWYNESLRYETDNIIINLVGFVFSLLIIKGLTKISEKANYKWILGFAIIIITVLGLLWVNFVKAPVKSDQKAVLNFAKHFSENQYTDLGERGYLYAHPLQLGCVLGMEFIIRVVHSSEWIVLQNINVGFIIICMILLYKISMQIYDDFDVQKTLAILSAMCFVIPMYAVVVYGNIYGFTFSLLGIFLMLKYFENNKIRYIILLPLTMAISIMFKSNYEIILIAILISLILDLIRSFKLKTIIAIALLLITLFGTYPLIYKIVEARTGVKPNDGIPMITYIAMSIQERVSRNSGWYHDYRNVETIYHGNSFDSKATAKESKKIIQERIEEFKGTPKMAEYFYLDKIKSTWLEPAFQTFWWSEALEEFGGQTEEYKEYITNNERLIDILHGKEHERILRYLDIIEIVIFGMSAFSIIVDFKNKTFNNQRIILLLCFLGGFLFHILWETKCIYVIPFYIMLLPSAADGINKIKVKKLSFKKKQNNI